LPCFTLIHNLGGVISFQAGKIEHIREYEITNTDTINIRFMPLNILLISTNVSRNTQLLTGSIKALNALYPTVVSPLFDSIDAISCQALEVLQKMAGTDDIGTNGSCPLLLNF
jgi:mevalonate kinase